MLRRDLLKMGSAAAIGMLAPGLLRNGAFAADPAATDQGASLAWNNTLVVIELSGGNDGLNTVVPYADPEYYKLRKNIGIPEKDVVKLDKGLGLHPALKPLEGAWKDGDLGVLLGLGYPNPNRSHFRGIDIWNAGSKTDEMLPDGWLARILNAASTGAPSDLLAHSITLGYSGGYGAGGALYGHQLNRLTMDRPDEFVRRAKRIPKPGDKIPNDAVSHIMHIQSDINKTADRLEALYRKAPNLSGFPGSGLGQHLQVAAKLIAAGTICPVYKTTIGGFDTHANQRPAQLNLLTELGAALGAFRDALKTVPGAWERTTVMTYSEFGRRAGENDSGGTDHGTAAPHFLMGGKVKGGFHGKQPSLTQLDYGDLMFTTDYRSMYAGIAQGFFGFKKPFLSDKGIVPLACFKA
jgi:uncharacterized protein (DUF1501 family)